MYLRETRRTNRDGSVVALIGRAAEHGDDLGSRVITSRLVGVAAHLAHMLERRWPPYAKWSGMSLGRLPRVGATGRSLTRAVDANEWRVREAALVDGLRDLHRLQREVGLSGVDDPVEPFWDRRYQGIREEVMVRLEASVTDEAVCSLLRGVGSAEQWASTRCLPSRTNGDEPKSP